MKLPAKFFAKSCRVFLGSKGGCVVEHAMYQYISNDFDGNAMEVADQKVAKDLAKLDSLEKAQAREADRLNKYDTMQHKTQWSVSVDVEVVRSALTILDKDDTRFYATCLACYPDGRMAASEGLRLIEAKAQAENVDENLPTDAFILVPVQALEAVVALQKKGLVHLYFSYCDRSVLISVENGTVETFGIGGQYPPYETAFPRNTSEDSIAWTKDLDLELVQAVRNTIKVSLAGYEINFDGGLLKSCLKISTGKCLVESEDRPVEFQGKHGQRILLVPKRA